jgi:diadenosine tetraphosphate (Ap4A) HIT family hydrolase
MIKRKNKAGIDKRFAKTKEYETVLEDIIDTDKCPFCPANFKYHKKPILNTHKGWLVTENSWPYENTRHHFLYIPEKHLEHIIDLTQQDLETVKHLVDWTINKYEIKGGALTIRFGEQTYTGATVLHLHFHLIVPELKDDKGLAHTINFPIG